MSSVIRRGELVSLDVLGVKLSGWIDVCMCMCVRVCRAGVWTPLPLFVRRSPSLFAPDDIITIRKHTHPVLGASTGCVCIYVSVHVRVCMH